MSGKPTILKDGTRLAHGNSIDGHKVGIVRFNKGSTALMRIDSVEEDQFGKRFYGINIIGDHHAAYAHDCLPATEDEIKTWMSYVRDRKTWCQNKANYTFY